MVSSRWEELLLAKVYGFPQKIAVYLIRTKTKVCNIFSCSYSGSFFFFFNFRQSFVSPAGLEPAMSCVSWPQSLCVRP